MSDVKHTIDIKMWDLILDMGFTSSCGLAREWILDGKITVDGVIVKDNKALLTVNADTIVELSDPRVDIQKKMQVGNTHPKFIARKYTI